MRHFLAILSLLATLLPAHAEDVKTPFGSFVAPPGVTVVNRDEKTDTKTGKPAGMMVFSRTNDPKAVFIVVWSYADIDPARPYDPLDGAVKIGDPFDKSLTRDAAAPVRVGGVEGGRYEGKMPNGLRAVSYVAVKHGYRLVVLLKAPPSSPYQELSDEFARRIEGFAWAVPEPAAAASASP